MFRVIILTEGSVLWGMGHLQRCVAYEEEFAAMGCRVDWRICGDAVARQFLQFRKGQLQTWWDEPRLAEELHDYQVAVVDSYHAPLSAYEVVAGRVKHCLYLDDEARLPYPRGFVVNSVPGAEKLSYTIGQGMELLAGPKYHPLRSEFRSGYDRQIGDVVRNVIIVMGGTDLRELSPMAVEQARRTYPEAVLQVVIANAVQRQKCSHLSSGKVKLLGKQSALEMRRLMEWADLSVSAAGQTLYELCRMGLPVVAVGVADNQRHLVDGLKAMGMILFSGWWNDLDLADQLGIALTEISDPAVRRNLARAGQALVDGRGAANAVTRLLAAG